MFRAVRSTIIILILYVTILQKICSILWVDIGWNIHYVLDRGVPDKERKVLTMLDGLVEKRSRRFSFCDCQHGSIIFEIIFDEIVIMTSINSSVTASSFSLARASNQITLTSYEQAQFAYID